jgi:vitamin B12 transporter
VTAEAGQVLQSQTGAPVTVIDSQTLDALNKPDVLEALRLVPGAQIVQGRPARRTDIALSCVAATPTSPRCSWTACRPTTSAAASTSRSSTPPASIASKCCGRPTASVYGSDALTGVVNIATRRGSARVPEFEYGIDGGNLRTFRNSIALGGAVRRYDYFSQYSYFTTDNHTPRSGYNRSTYAGRFGAAVGAGTNVSGTLRWLDGEFGSANAILAVSDCRRLHERKRPAVRDDHRGLAAHRSLAEHGSLRLGRSDDALHESDADGNAVRSVRLRRQLPRATPSR